MKEVRMRALLLFAGAVVMAVGYGASSLPSGSSKSASAGSSPSLQTSDGSPNRFPEAGVYDILRERAGRREETDMWVDASNRPAFEELIAPDSGSDCRDRSVSINAGTFSVRMTCDAPDGDIHNVKVQREGSYSTNSIEFTTETTLWGTPIRETARYQLRKRS
jgi:hypothetical protein